MGKEIVEVIGEDIKIVDGERQALCEGFMLRESGDSCSVESNVTIIDAKMRTTLSGLGGAFCLFCHVDKDTANRRGFDKLFHHHSNWRANIKEIRPPLEEARWVSDDSKRRRKR